MPDELSFDAPADAPAPDAPTTDDPVFDVKINGKVERVPLSELRNGYSRTADYTRGKQALAAERREWSSREAQYQQALVEARDVLQNRDALYQHLVSLGWSPQQASQKVDAQAAAGDETLQLTKAQVQHLLDERDQKLRQEVQTQTQGVAERLTLDRTVAEYSGYVEAKLTEIASRHPVLPQIPGMDFLIKETVRRQRPESVEQALQLMDQVADHYAQSLSAAAKINPTPPRVAGIEPPRGSAPTPRGDPEAFDSVKDPRLRSKVLDDLQRLMTR
jgi:hypothetical protein